MQKYSISGDEAARLFHEKASFFEKILIQYEYLHQVSQQEAFGICRKSNQGRIQRFNSVPW